LAELFLQLTPMPKPLPTLFGYIIRRRREEKGMSQEKLGEKTNLTRNYIGMVERGETNPTLLVLQSLAKALNTTMVSLIYELESETGSPNKKR
jgi:transcriptional regulator with XRE-family HTH domain